MREGIRRRRQRSALAYGAPARAGGSHQTIEALERRVVGRRREVRRRDPAHRRHRDRDKENSGRVDGRAKLLRNEESDGDDERAGHCRDLAPRADAPPEPTKKIDQTRAGANLQNEVKALLRRLQTEDERG